MYRDPSMTGLASLVQSRGRNNDSMLVHMTPGEVQGLQRLALAHGGSLTINPHTGLYEAGFLSKLLPMLAGLGLSFIPGVGPLMAASIVGGFEGIRTGDLGKGLMAGLGAYGGAGLGTAFASSGAKLAAEKAAENVATSNIATGAGAGLDSVATGLGIQPVEAAATAAVPSAGLSTAADPYFANMMAGAPKTFASNLSNFGGGASAFGKGLMSAPGATIKALGSQLGSAGVAGLGLTAANAMTPDYSQPNLQSDEDQPYWESYGYSPEQGRFLGGQFVPHYPGWTGTKKYADGGAVGMDGPPQTLAGPAQNPSAKGSGLPSPNVAPAQPPASSGGLGLGSLFGGTPQQPLPQGPMQSPPEDMEGYYRGLLTPPQQQPQQGNNSFMDYMSGLNSFVESPLPAPTPSTTSTPAGQPSAQNPLNPYGTNVPSTSNPYIDESYMSGVNDPGMASYLSSIYGALGNYNSGTPGMQWNPSTGTFGESSGSTPSMGNVLGGIRSLGNNSESAPLTELQPQEAYLTPAYQEPYNQVADEVARYEPDRSGMPQQLHLPEASHESMSYIWSDGTKHWQPEMPNLVQQPPQSSAPIERSAYPDMYSDMQMLQPTDYSSAYQSSDMIPEVRVPDQTQYMTPQAYAPQPMNYGIASSPSYSPAKAPVATPLDSVSNMNSPYNPYSAAASMYSNPDQGVFGDYADKNIFGFAEGGPIEYAAAGKLLHGPGDGMSDDIHANINGAQEARLADGEFVVPADVVSHLGNGSTDAGADRLHEMMDRVRKARTGKSKQAPAVKVKKYLPA